MIGDRTLHVPVSLPYFHADRAGTRNSAWFSFHIDNQNHWSFGGYDSYRPFIWEYLLTIEITNAPGRVDDKSFLGIFLNGAKKDVALSAQNKLYDVYPGDLEDKYVGKWQNSDVQLFCSRKFSGYKGKQVPACMGGERPWTDAALTYTFGRGFLPIAPQILSCVRVFLDDFSR